MKALNHVYLDLLAHQLLINTLLKKVRKSECRVEKGASRNEGLKTRNKGEDPKSGIKPLK